MVLAVLLGMQHTSPVSSLLTTFLPERSFMRGFGTGGGSSWRGIICSTYVRRVADRG